MWRVFNLVVALFRLAIGAACVLSGNVLATLYGAAEVFGGVLAVANAIKGADGDWSPRGFAVGSLYLVGLFVLPVAGPVNLVVVAGEIVVIALLFYTRWIAWTTYTCGAPCWVRLVDRGPYRFVRHPQATVAILARWLFVVGNPCAWNVATGLAFSVAMVASALLEESYLSGVPAWRAYAQRVRARFVPRAVRTSPGAA